MVETIALAFAGDPVWGLTLRVGQTLPEDLRRYWDVSVRRALRYQGSHPDWRGRGLGMGLIKSCLVEFDAKGVPSYLESSNPANDHRYESAGYRTVVRFVLSGGQVFAGIWREVGG
jgi:hypothetical protein